MKNFALFTRNLIFGLFAASIVIICLIGLGIFWQSISGSFGFEMKEVKAAASGDSPPIIVLYFLQGMGIAIAATCIPLFIIWSAMCLSDFGGALLDKLMSRRAPESRNES